MTLLFASSNPGKITEVRSVARSHKLTVLSPEDLIGAGKVPSNKIPDVNETEPTYHGNAKLKAEAFFKWSNIPSLADDSGLEVDELQGAPGVITARYAGPNATSAENMAKLLGALNGVTNRTAHFTCYLYYWDGNGMIRTSTGTLQGQIAEAPRGSGGFGYDSIFIVDGLGKTLAELKDEGAQIKTHRISALFDLFNQFPS